MKMITLAAPLALGFLLACGGPPQPATPAAEPVAEPETSEPDAVESEAAEPAESAEPEDESDEVQPSMPPLEPERPPCHTLEKSRCSVMQGCKWYEKAGKGECMDE
jgi:hypothetical protein